MPIRRLSVACTLAATIGFGGSSHAQTASQTAPPSMSLKEAVDLAIAHNRQIQAARIDVEIAGLNLRSTASSFFQAELTADGSDQRNSAFGDTISTRALNSAIHLSQRLFSGGVAAVDTGLSVAPAFAGGAAQTLNFSFSQPLLRGFGRTVTRAPIRQSEISLTLSSDTLTQTLMDVVLRVEQTYWALLLQTEADKLQRDALDRSRRLREMTLALIDAGRVAKNELVHADADIALQEVAIVTADESLRKAENDLRDVLDMDLPAVAAPIAPPADELVAADRAASLQLAFLNRPDWKSAELQIESAELDTTTAKSGRLPEVDVASSYGRQGIGGSFGSAVSGLADRSSTSVGLTLDVPLNNTQNLNAYAGAQLSLKRSRIAFDKQRQQIELEIDDVVRGVNAAIRQVGLTRTARELAERALAVEIEKLRVGRSTGFNVVQLQNEVNAAFSTELQARISYLLARATLAHSTGTILQLWNIPSR
jgi:outer membrane protein TolC